MMKLSLNMAKKCRTRDFKERLQRMKKIVFKKSNTDVEYHKNQFSHFRL